MSEDTFSLFSLLILFACWLLIVRGCFTNKKQHISKRMSKPQERMSQKSNQDDTYVQFPEDKSICTVTGHDTSEQTEEPFFFTWEDFVQKNFYISRPWSLDYYYSVRGSENVHIYLWVAKDLSWSQGWEVSGMLFGCLAICWCFVLLYHAIHSKNMEEIYMWIGLVLWLTANFIWMTGELVNGDDDYVVPRTAHTMLAAIIWLVLYHLVVKPFKIITIPDNYDESIYGRSGLVSRFSYFTKWRQYEHAHTLCWLGKDISWNQDYGPTWIIFLLPTVLIALDFIVVTFRTKRMMEDTLHYVAQLMWVLGNMFWALGEIYVNQDDDAAIFVFNMSDSSKYHMRYIASWVLFAAYWPLIALYVVWIPLTIWNKFPNHRDSIKQHLTAHSTQSQSA